MTYLVVAFVGALCLLNLLLTFGVIRRLRVHTDLLSRRGGGEQPTVMLGTGELVAEFETSTVDGRVLSRDRLSGSTLVAFFSPHCQACVEQLPRFVDRAAAVPGGREQVVAVLVGGEAETREQRERLEPVAQIVMDTPSGVVPRAFSVVGFPAFALLEPDGTVSASGYDVDTVVPESVLA
jgi:hypothetical protein